MSRIIYCIFLKKHAEGLQTLCYPGKLGIYIYNHISQIAWKKWIDQQTILINEQKLNMIKTTDQIILEKQMKLFLFNENITI